MNHQQLLGLQMTAAVINLFCYFTTLQRPLHIKIHAQVFAYESILSISAQHIDPFLNQHDMTSVSYGYFQARLTNRLQYLDDQT